jgi:hypothetical protein
MVTKVIIALLCLIYPLIVSAEYQSSITLEKYVKTILGDGHHHIPNNSTLEFDYMVSPLNVEQYMAGPPVRLYRIDQLI